MPGKVTEGEKTGHRYSNIRRRIGRGRGDLPEVEGENIGRGVNRALDRMVKVWRRWDRPNPRPKVVGSGVTRHLHICATSCWETPLRPGV